MAVISNKTTAANAEDSFFSKLLFPKDAEGVPRPPLLLSFSLMIVAAIALGLYRWYMEATSFTLGLDYFEPEFEIYWMTWFYGQIALTGILLVIGLPVVWFTRPSKEEVLSMSPSSELGRYVLIFTVAAVMSFLAICVLGIWVEADAAWHQVTIRDTDFTPTHIQLFYGLIPLGAVGGVLGMVYLHTRMPDYMGRVSIPVMMMGAAPLLIMPNLGYNEWGHTFFYAEELFASSVHYGFVTLGWGLFAITGFLLECFNRILELTRLRRGGVIH